VTSEAVVDETVLWPAADAQQLSRSVDGAPNRLLHTNDTKHTLRDTPWKCETIIS